jgi:transposase InsO family protein
MKYQFVADHSHEFPVTRMCRVLAVSTSGYYAWRGRPQSQRARDNLELVDRIKEVHAASRETYGSPRVHAELVQGQGIQCNKKRVERLMRIHDIRGRQRRRRRVKTTDSNHSLPVAPNRKWVADITYVPTAQGWLYLAVVLDLFSRRVIGWSMAETMCTLLVKDALEMAVSSRHPLAGLLHHSDRGSQYASAEYQAVLQTGEIVASMSRAGDCYDNAAMESFFGTLKCELIHDRRYRTRTEARQDIFEYIEVFYNRQRRHSSLGYLSPVAYEGLCQLRLN